MGSQLSISGAQRPKPARWFEGSLRRRVAGFSRGPSSLIWPCLCLDRTQDRTGPSPRVRESSRISGTKKNLRGPLTYSRPLRWVVMRNPRANAGFHSIHIGQEPRSGASWHLASCHLTSDECNEDSARFRGGLFHYFIDRDLRNLCK